MVVLFRVVFSTWRTFKIATTSTCDLRWLGASANKGRSILVWRNYLKLPLDVVLVLRKPKLKIWIFCEKSRQNERSSALCSLDVNKVSRNFLSKIRLWIFCVIIKTPSSVQNCYEVNQSWTLPMRLLEELLERLRTWLTCSPCLAKRSRTLLALSDSAVYSFLGPGEGSNLRPFKLCSHASMGVGSTAPLRFPNSAIIFDKFRYILYSVARWSCKNRRVDVCRRGARYWTDRMMVVAGKYNGEINATRARAFKKWSTVRTHK